LLCGRFLEDSGADDGFSKFRVVGLEGASAGLLRCIGLGGAHVCGVLVVVCVAHCIDFMMLHCAFLMEVKIILRAIWSN
jgi:hypothetical protein